MNRKSRHRIRRDGSRIITIISVAMVLLVTGITMTLGFGVDRAADLVRSNMGLVIVVDPSGGDASVDSLVQALTRAPYTESVVSRNADEVLARWEELMGPEEMLDVNPFLPEIEVTVKPQWTKPDSLEAIASRIEGASCVDHTQAFTDVAAGLSHTISSIILILCVTGLTLLVVSVVLIANTVKLQLHAQRFMIHTQQYVGATPGYIVAPYTRRAALDGLMAALIALVMLGGIVAYITAIDPLMLSLLTGSGAAATAAVTIAGGTGICAVTARITALNYVNRSYDEIFN